MVHKPFFDRLFHAGDAMLCVCISLKNRVNAIAITIDRTDIERRIDVGYISSVSARVRECESEKG